MDSRPEPPLTVYRISDGRHPLFDGTGAAIHGARWNSPGRPVIYAAATYAGAMLEVLVRAGSGRVPRHFQWIAITIPSGISCECLEPDGLPGWDQDDGAAPRAAGDAWLREARSAVLFAPSVVTRREFNVLINPAHPEFRLIGASAPQPVVWDRRLFDR